MPASSPPYYDVNGDGNLSPIDALIIINELNNPTALTVSSDAAPQAAGYSAAISNDSEVELSLGMSSPAPSAASLLPQQAV